MGRPFGGKVPLPSAGLNSHTQTQASSILFLKNFQAEYEGVGASSSWVSVGFSKTALMPRSSAVLSSPDVSPVSRLYWNPADYGRPQEVKDFVGLNGGIQTDVIIRDEEYLYAQ